MKVSVYELLGMVKDGKIEDEDEQKIKIDNKIITVSHLLGAYIFSKERLNDEVEIIEEEKEMCHKCHKYPAEYNQTYCEFCLGISNLEEEKKIPEKLETYKDRNNEIFLDDLCYKHIPIQKDSLSFNEKVIVDKLNEVLDYLKNKGDE